jgi:hypothetical protein
MLGTKRIRREGKPHCREGDGTDAALLKRTSAFRQQERVPGKDYLAVIMSFDAPVLSLSSFPGQKSVYLMDAWPDTTTRSRSS